MKKKVIAIAILGMFLLTSMTSFSTVGKTLKNQTKTNNTSPIGDKAVNIGSMTIGENFIEFDVEDKNIWVTEGGEDITIKATVHFRLHGWCDHGYAYLGLWNQPAEDQADHGEEADVTLSFTINNCNHGDVFEIELKGKYTDCINEDFSERKKVIVTIKEDIEPDLWPKEIWVSSEKNDWDKNHVITKTNLGTTVYVHLIFYLLYSEGKKCPAFYNKYEVYSPKIFPVLIGDVKIPSTVGTGSPKELQMVFKIDGEFINQRGTYAINVFLDQATVITELLEDVYHFDEKDEGNNDIATFLSARKTRSRNILFSLNLLERFPLLEKLLQNLW